MMNLASLLSAETVQPLGWTLVHFLWQGSVLALLLAVVLRTVAKASAQARYVAAGVTLLLMLAAPVLTFFQLSGHESAAAVAGPVQADQVATAAPGASQALSLDPAAAASWSSAGDWLAGWIPAVVVLWTLGASLLLLRLLGGWWGTRSLRRRAISPAPAGLIRCAEELRDAMGIRRQVRLLQSSRVDVMTVVGWLSPVILVPASSVTGLSTPQLRAILAHELAHIRRHDVLVNGLQRIAETLLFYHPAVWWTSNLLRTERENLCDDAAVEVSGDPLGYARALATLEGLRRTGELAMAANGGTLLARVRRLLQPGYRPTNNVSLPALLIAGTTVAFALIVPALAAPEAAAAPSARSEQVRASIYQQIEDARSRGELNADAMVQEALPNLRSSVADTREQGAWVLGQVGDERSVEPLLAMTGDPDAGVREMVAWALGRVGDERSVKPLLELLEDSSASVRAKAAWALGLRGDQRAVNGLRAAAEDASDDVREQAVWALCLVADEGESRSFEGALLDASPEVRRRGAWALGLHGTGDSLPALEQSLSDSSAIVREQVVWALGMIGDPRATEVLRGAAQDDSSEPVRSRAAWALDRLQRGPEPADEATGQPFDFFDPNGRR
ncbi:MAG: M56 family metallopeptidase [Acidobacteriota bacterium]|nr:M56 family metallopeptidase [Acidobacteriota bacterium]